MKYYLICYMSRNKRIFTLLCTDDRIKELIQRLQSAWNKIISISEIQKEIFDILEETE